MSTLSELFTLQLPDDWTPEQALAVYELLNDLAEAIWNRYDRVLIDYLAADRDPDDGSPSDLFDLDDPLPF
jgi:hypothetical protein